MHSRAYLRTEDFCLLASEPHGAGEIRLHDAVPHWSPDDRVVVVAPDPASDLAATSALLLALTHAFYDRPAAREPGFFDYPAHFVVGGQYGAAPQVLGPSGQRPWSRAWCGIDVWPNTHHAICDPSPARLLEAVFMLEPTRLVWPARLARPDTAFQPTTPVSADFDSIRRLLRRRLRQVLLYACAGEEPAAPGAWRVSIEGRSRELAIQALERLPRNSGAMPERIGSAWFRSVPVAEFV